jgi:hypothetical protein
VALETHRLAFVDSIAASPVVRLEMSGMTQGPFNMRVGTRFDPPPLKRSIPSSLLADGGAPTSASYDNRTIVLQLQPMVNGVAMAADAAAAQMQLLYRELDRPANILRYQAGTTSPVFFRTYRSGPGLRRLRPGQQGSHDHPAGRTVRVRPGGNPVGHRRAEQPDHRHVPRHHLAQR